MSCELIHYDNVNIRKMNDNLNVNIDLIEIKRDFFDVASNKACE